MSDRTEPRQGSPGHLPPVTPQDEHRYVKPHRAGVVLALAVLAVAVCILIGVLLVLRPGVVWPWGGIALGAIATVVGLIDLSMSNSDLREMAADEMDGSGKVVTAVGRVGALIALLAGVVIFGWGVISVIIAYSRTSQV